MLCHDPLNHRHNLVALVVFPEFGGLKFGSIAGLEAAKETFFIFEGMLD